MFTEQDTQKNVPKRDLNETAKVNVEDDDVSQPDTKRIRAEASSSDLYLDTVR